jgi:hypothetical protein
MTRESPQTYREQLLAARRPSRPDSGGELHDTVIVVIVFMICLAVAAVAIARTMPTSEASVPFQQWPAGAI